MLRSKVELGIDWRQHDPAYLGIGPVLHIDDAVANKVLALFGRARARDAIDVESIMTSGRYAHDDLLTLAAEHDAGFDHAIFAQALRATDRLADEEFAAYGLSAERIAHLRQRLHAWSRQIDGSPSTSD